MVKACEEYELVVGGRLGPRLVAEIGFEVVEAGATTRLRGWLRDQADLHSLLATIADLNVELVSVRHVDREVPGHPRREEGPQGP